MSTLTITLRDEDRRFIENTMKKGHYISESEVVADAIAELKAREQLQEVRRAELRTQISIGVDQLDRGEGMKWNSERIRTKGRTLLPAPRTN